MANFKIEALAPPRRNGTDQQSYQSHRSTTDAERKALQSAKIKELRLALLSAGVLTLDEQAQALGLCRSTAWTILKGNHKASGISASTINRILKSPKLPPEVLVLVIEYVSEKVAGVYGHRMRLRKKFADRLLVVGDQVLDPEVGKPLRRSVTGIRKVKMSGQCT
jgi:hypothetical protein